jgi:hypothetical protein
MISYSLAHAIIALRRHMFRMFQLLVPLALDPVRRISIETPVAPAALVTLGRNRRRPIYIARPVPISRARPRVFVVYRRARRAVGFVVNHTLHIPVRAEGEVCVVRRIVQVVAPTASGHSVPTAPSPAGRRCKDTPRQTGPACFLRRGSPGRSSCEWHSGALAHATATSPSGRPIVAMPVK